MTPLRPPVSAGTKSTAPQKTVNDNPPWKAAWGAELKKFIDKPVVVEFLVGPDVVRLNGRLASFDLNACHCVIDTETESVFVRIPLSITRQRRHQKQVTKPEVAG